MESRKRRMAMVRYLNNAVPHAKVDILKAVDAGKLIPVWNRGVLSFQGEPEAKAGCKVY